jgi:hypothetical protein
MVEMDFLTDTKVKGVIGGCMVILKAAGRIHMS